MTDLLIQIFSAYILTLLVVANPVFDRQRKWVKDKTAFLVVGGKHLLDCRLCSGLWVSLVVAVFYGTLENILLIYGASYFLATQERR